MPTRRMMGQRQIYRVRNVQHECTYTQVGCNLTVDSLERWRWLIKPINAILRWLGAQRVDSVVSVSTVTIPVRDELPQMIRDVIYTYERETGRPPVYLIIGYDKFKLLQHSPEFHLRQDITLNTNSFLGVKLILHPFVDGLIPLGEIK